MSRPPSWHPVARGRYDSGNPMLDRLESGVVTPEIKARIQEILIQPTGLEQGTFNVSNQNPIQVKNSGGFNVRNENPIQVKNSAVLPARVRTSQFDDNDFNTLLTGVRSQFFDGKLNALRDDGLIAVDRTGSIGQVRRSATKTATGQFPNAPNQRLMVMDVNPKRNKVGSVLFQRESTVVPQQGSLTKEQHGRDRANVTYPVLRRSYEAGDIAFERIDISDKRKKPKEKKTRSKKKR